MNSELCQKIEQTYTFRGTTEICGNFDAETKFPFGGKRIVSKLDFKKSEQSEETYGNVMEHFYWRNGCLNGQDPGCIKRQRISGSLGAF